MRFEKLSQWLDWLEQLHPREIDLGLERIAVVAKAMDILPLPATVVTVAGTNGKVSTIAALQALLFQLQTKEEGGRTAPRVASYTSPHLCHFAERICLDGHPVDEQMICRALADVDAARQHCTVDGAVPSLTYFEFTTLAALSIFSAQRPDYILLEVGLGGRLDAVNVVDADLAIVTAIDLDHQQWLGSDREQIGAEQAGVFRHGQTVVIAAPAPPETLLLRAEQLACKLYQASAEALDEDIAQDAAQLSQHGFFPRDGALSWFGVDRAGRSLVCEDLARPLLAEENWSAALQAALLLGALPAAPKLTELLSQTTLPGRLSQHRFAERNLLLDVAHNPQAVARLGEHLAAQGGARVAIFAAMADKDIGAMLDSLMGLCDRWIFPSLQNCPRAANPLDLQLQLEQLSPSAAANSELAASVEESLSKAIHNSHQNDKIVVFGSFYSVAEALTCFTEGVDTEDVGTVAVSRGSEIA